MGANAPVRCLHLGDLHIGYESRELGDKNAGRSRERDMLLARITEFALDPKNAIDIVLIAGDLFEIHRPPPDKVDEVIRNLRSLVSRGIILVTTPGNHDEITYSDSVYRTHESRWPGLLVTNPMPAHVLTKPVRGTAVHVYSMAYTGGVTKTAPPLSDFPRSREDGIHIAVFHGSLRHDGSDRSLPIDRAALISAGYDYVALGHIHRPTEEEAMLVGGVRKTKLVYPGLIDTRGFFDEGHGHYTVANIWPGQVLIERVPAGVRKYHSTHIDLTALADRRSLEHLIERIAAGSGKGSIVRLVLTGKAWFPVNPEELARQFESYFYHFEVVGDSTYLSDADLAEWATERTIRGEFIRRMNERISHASDPAEVRVLKKALSYGLLALEGGERR